MEINKIGRQTLTGRWTVETLLKKVNPSPKEGDYATVGGQEYRWNELEQTWETIGAEEAEMNDSGVNLTRSLGDYDNLLELWKAVPNRGEPGDYATVDEHEYYWTGTGWKAVAAETESRSVHMIEHSLTVGADLRVGGAVISSAASIESYDKLILSLYEEMKSKNAMLTQALSQKQQQLEALSARIVALEALPTRIGALEQRTGALEAGGTAGTGMTPQQAAQLSQAVADVSTLRAKESTWDAAAQAVSRNQQAWTTAAGLWTTEDGNLIPTGGRGIATEGNVISYASVE